MDDRDWVESDPLDQARRAMAELAQDQDRDSRMESWAKAQAQISLALIEAMQELVAELRRLRDEVDRL